jgi:hypothetical protein
MLGLICLADHVEAHRPRDDGVPVSRLLGEPDAIVRQDRMDAVWHGIEKQLQELPSGLSVRLLDQLGPGELARSINGYEEIELTLGRPELGDVDVEEADGYRLKRGFFGLSPSMSGSREMPCRCRQLCKEDRVRCGIVGWRA